MSFNNPVEEYLSPVSAENPCGVVDDLLENQFSNLESAIKKKGIQELSQAAAIFFRGGKLLDFVDGKAQIDLKKTRHLLPAMVLAVAWLEKDGFAGLADGLALIDGLLTSHWDKIYPLGNPSDETDPYYKRLNILSALTIPNLFKGPGPGRVSEPSAWAVDSKLFKTALFTTEKQGAVSFADCLSPWALAWEIKLPEGEVKSKDFVYEARLASMDTLQSQRTCIESAITSLESIIKIFQDNPGNNKPNLDFLLKLLRAALSIVNDAPENPNQVTQANPGQPKAISLSPSTGPVSSREDAVRKLAEVADYFRRNEPSSPVSLLVERAKNLAGMNFLKLLQELNLGDQALPAFEKLAGIKPKGEETSTPEKPADSA